MWQKQHSQGDYPIGRREHSFLVQAHEQIVFETLAAYRKDLLPGRPEDVRRPFRAKPNKSAATCPRPAATGRR
jgi:hypothetical protein